MVKPRLNLALIFGGRSAEREVSINTAKQIAMNLDPQAYRLLPIEILTDGEWSLDSPEVRALGAQRPMAMLPDPRAAAQSLLPLRNCSAGISTNAQSPLGIDVVFLALHGPYGEDGTIQGMMEMLGLRYTCSGVLASALAMDKYRTQQLVEQDGILVPKYLRVARSSRTMARGVIRRRLGLPCVVKPLRLGSSVGISIVKKVHALDGALQAAFEFGPDVLVEQFIAGREITAAVLGNDDPKPLPLIEIRPKVSHFFDYKAKYEMGGSEEICPAPIAAALTRRIQNIARRVHLLLGCRGVTRSDFMVDRRGQAYFLEINTIPGMTQTSLVPQAARQAGISFPKLLDRLIELALSEGA